MAKMDDAVTLDTGASAGVELVTGASAGIGLVTGASAGVGLATAEQLAKLGYRVFAACRSEAKARPAIDAIKARTGNPNIELLPLDLGDLDSVRECARQFLALGQPLHLLINNAG
ncbi:MAG TPA: SDR family NAD(P)-dependent oxidoreductase, partial [Polyangiales bacterium]|nr:SDR family NAD(P)-dependent oxidoreductase [Polyangiales bacterium]